MSIEISSSDTENIVKVPDSWVKETKLLETSGHGEKKLYIGGNTTGKYDKFFESDKIVGIINKDNLQSYLNIMKNEYLTYYNKYRLGEGMRKLFSQNITRIEKMNDQEKFELEHVDIKGNRFYINSDSDWFDLLRYIALPEISQLKISKFRTDKGQPKFNFELFPVDEYKRSKVKVTPLTTDDDSYECVLSINKIWDNFDAQVGKLPTDKYCFMTQYNGESDYFMLGMEVETGERMILKQVEEFDQISDYHSLVSSFIYKSDQKNLSQDLEYLSYKNENTYFSIIKYLGSEISFFSKLACMLCNQLQNTKVYFETNRTLRNYHRKFNKMSPEETFRYFRKNPEVFRDYHMLYRESRKNGVASHIYLTHFIISHYHKKLLIGDFGCGEALLAQNLEQIPLVQGKRETHQVINLDHYDFSKFQDIDKPVPNGIKIHEVDVSQYYKLKQVFSEYGEDEQLLDVAIFSLSLWGTSPNNREDVSGITMSLRNANKFLKPKGELHIIETCSRLGIIRNDNLKLVLDNHNSKVRKFISRLENFGFKVDKDEILNINLRDESIYNQSGGTFIHIIVEKGQFKPIDTNIDVGIIFTEGESVN